ncbi:MAG TPA: asparagine synthase (glutamine-hydrolyzing) [Microbacteriaceae bacterium]|jgi:asparagine synthase (glutamine-hydrolysing)|nr:asparagine synthase (glutamine-hydrolyzing) [Microbacteriaceae bacterium]
MCGIAGILDTKGAPIDADLLRRMTDAIAHRGPDGEGWWTEGGVGLGNRRLAIIDLSDAGRQPMTNEDDSIVLTYNGEIYNFRELRTELERAGHTFRSHTDSEVVVHAYEEWGIAALERFNGMFAFALWDASRRRLVVARDRFGVKPVYYTRVGDALLFGSEIKSFLEHPAFRVEVSAAHLHEYFTFQNVFSDGTLFAGVQLLPAGCALIVQKDGRMDVERYWDFNFAEPDAPGDEREYAEELDRLFTAAVERQLVSDVPVGAFLSGGMDSGSVTAVAAKSLPYLSTFTGGFDLTSASGLELGFDERQKAEAMSYLFKTEHYETVLKAGDMERCLGALVWHLEDPRVGQSYPNYYISRLASKFVKVALSGTGGDELFAGYPWRYYRAVVNDDFEHYVEKYYRFWHRLVPNATMSSLFQPSVWNQVKDVRTIDIFTSMLPDREPPTSPEDYVNHSLHLEAKTFLHGLLVVEDKLSMAHGLETRVPFLDNDLVDFAQRVPVRLKLRDLEHVVKLNENEPGPKTNKYFEQTRDGKLLLRRVMERHVPDVVTQQVKQGFSGPDATWFRGESLDYVRRVIDDDRSLMYEFLDPATVRSLVAQHTSGFQNRRLLLWSLLNFEHWCRTFLAGARP